MYIVYFIFCIFCIFCILYILYVLCIKLTISDRIYTYMYILLFAPWDFVIDPRQGFMPLSAWNCGDFSLVSGRGGLYMNRAASEMIWRGHLGPIDCNGVAAHSVFNCLILTLVLPIFRKNKVVFCLVQIKGWYGIFPTEETKLACAIIDFCQEQYILLASGVLKLSKNGPKTVPHGPPIPIPGVSKSLLPGGKTIRQTHVWWFSMILWQKSKKH